MVGVMRLGVGLVWMVKNDERDEKRSYDNYLSYIARIVLYPLRFVKRFFSPVVAKRITNSYVKCESDEFSGNRVRGSNCVTWDENPSSWFKVNKHSYHMFGKGRIIPPLSMYHMHTAYRWIATVNAINISHHMGLHYLGFGKYSGCKVSLKRAF